MLTLAALRPASFPWLLLLLLLLASVAVMMGRSLLFFLLLREIIVVQMSAAAPQMRAMTAITITAMAHPGNGLEGEAALPFKLLSLLLLFEPLDGEVEFFGLLLLLMLGDAISAKGKKK